jgi:hypothetical protein
MLMIPGDKPPRLYRRRGPIRRTKNFRLIDPHDRIDDATMEQALAQLEKELEVAKVWRALRRLRQTA